jgi:protocatechuate 3,4-dioxygenase beta subunit
MSPQPLSRRQALGALGAVSLSGLLAACGSDEDTAGAVTTTNGSTATVETKTSTTTASSKLTAEQFDSAATCDVAAELTEGPYYFDVDSIRSDIREDRKGTLLRLGVRVRDAESCEPIENAIVDVWHCDALGIYSGFESSSEGSGGAGGAPPGGAPPRGAPPSGEAPPAGGQQPGDAGVGGSSRSDDETYLRGAQATNSDGIAEFKTIYPGWYRGRTTHVHAKVHLDKSTLLTTQFFTTKAMDDVIYAREPYSEDTRRDTFNESDSIYVKKGELTLSEAGESVVGLITLDVKRS